LAPPVASAVVETLGAAPRAVAGAGAVDVAALSLLTPPAPPCHRPASPLALAPKRPPSDDVGGPASSRHRASTSQARVRAELRKLCDSATCSDGGCLTAEAEYLEMFAATLRLLAACGATLERETPELGAAVLWGMGYAVHGTGGRCAKMAWREAGVDVGAAKVLTARLMGVMGSLGCDLGARDTGVALRSEGSGAGAKCTALLAPIAAAGG